MTQEDKELLLIDICGRSPYGVVCKISYTFNNETTDWEDVESACDDIITKINFDTKEVFSEWLSEYSSIDDVKPYLRPMSSMTEEEKIEANNLGIFTAIAPNGGKVFDGFGNVSCEIQLKAFDWLNAHHFDYRGLIEKGLALEATEGMYKTE